ncbi:MAG TPA: thioether cross-link-forming SCIFF peptide maturase [Clostridia bacterium]|nr:thioether cross-link-forming SCIFF peptide maturase [Clostridia bacterium]
MVKAFKSNLSENERYFLYDIESGSLHDVDYATFLLAKFRYDILDEIEADAFSKLDGAVVQEVKLEIEEMEKEGLLNSPTEIYKIPFTGEIKAMCLHICHDCNLRCPYCFAHSGTYNTAKDYMTFEVGKSAIDMLIKMSGVRKNIEVDFFGGEPLMNMGVVKQIVEYAQNAVKSAGKHITFTMTTNGVLLNDENRKWLNENMDNVVISIDGREEVHDALRVSANGKGSHAIALKNALEFRKIRGDKRYYIRGTFTQKNLDFATDALYLNDLGFDQISIEPVVLDENDPLAIKTEDLETVFAQYDILAKEYVKRRRGDKWFNYFHFMLDLKHGPCITKRLRGCGAGSEYVAVTPVGDIYPCHQFVTDKDYYMGNVLSGEFNKEIQRKFFDANIYEKEDCQNCVAKYYCSGGCKANSLHFAGDFKKSYKLSCEMMIKRFLSSLAIYAEEEK